MITQKIGDLTSRIARAVDEDDTAEEMDGAWFDRVNEEKAKVNDPGVIIHICFMKT